MIWAKVVGQEFSECGHENGGGRNWKKLWHCMINWVYFYSLYFEYAASNSVAVFNHGFYFTCA